MGIISIIFWFAVIGLFIGQWGQKREIGFWPAFLLSLFLSPVVGAIVVAVSKKKEVNLPLSVRYYKQAQRYAFKQQYAEAIDKYQDALFEIHNGKMPEKHRRNQIDLIEGKLASIRKKQDSPQI